MKDAGSRLSVGTGAIIACRARTGL